MPKPQPNPIQRFFGAALIAVGFMMMLLCGGCGVVFFIGFLIGGLTSSNHEDVGLVIMPIVLGGLPALIGLGLFAAGRGLRRAETWIRPVSGASRPPPSGPPPG
jgi:hypothetical protein